LSLWLSGGTLQSVAAWAAMAVDSDRDSTNIGFSMDLTFPV
jgi:hypothetical protein